MDSRRSKSALRNKYSPDTGWIKVSSEMVNMAFMSRENGLVFASYSPSVSHRRRLMRVNRVEDPKHVHQQAEAVANVSPWSNQTDACSSRKRSWSARSLVRIIVRRWSLAFDSNFDCGKFNGHVNANRRVTILFGENFTIRIKICPTEISFFEYVHDDCRALTCIDRWKADAVSQALLRLRRTEEIRVRNERTG